jgi:hypothetical protein
MLASAGEIRALAERAGFDGEKFLALATSEDAPDVGPLSGLDREMALSEPERVALAEAYVFGRDDLADLIRRGDTFNDACTLVLDTTGRGSTRRTRGASSTSWAPSAMRRGRRRSGSRRRSGWRREGSRRPGRVLDLRAGVLRGSGLCFASGLGFSLSAVA